MEKLQRLVTDAEGPINIIEESACKFKEIGTILLNSTKVDNIAASVRGNQVEVVREIYKQWMQEDVHYSWTKLTQCLRQCELKVLASQIEQHFGLPSSEGILSTYQSFSSTEPLIPQCYVLFSLHLQTEKSMEHLNTVTVVCYIDSLLFFIFVSVYTCAIWLRKKHMHKADVHTISFFAFW